MKTFTFVCLFVLALTAPAFAIGPGVAIGAHANFTLSNFPGPATSGATSLQDAYGMGIGGGLHLDINLMVISFRLSGDYVHYALDQDKFRDAFRPVFGNAVSQLSIDGGGLGIYSLTANGKMNIVPLPVITPYFTGGIGLAWLTRDEVKTSIAGAAGATTPSATQSGCTSFNLGAGVDLSVGISLFVEAKYVWILTEGETSTYVPVTIGVTF
jgi:opacity protein-like surface antigen